jgi:hypothetical protein
VLFKMGYNSHDNSDNVEDAICHHKWASCTEFVASPTACNHPLLGS